ncbi:MAG: peptidyl-prolyl cis-trans isomerase, partial [Hyphomicrobiales bacterium]|nr:peptidyl-prolyl cis-trans isomerase [Hyphomicrobiales bacterium]
EIKPPGADALKSYFDERKESYRAPEYRDFTLVVASPSSLAKPGEVSDEDAKAEYEKTKDARFTTPEKRKLQQILFPSEAEADEAEAKIKAGASFDDIVKERKLSSADVDLGETTKAAMFDQALADAAFALPDGGSSDVIKGQFGSVILHVASVTPGSVKPFSEVEDSLKKEIATSRAAADVQTLHDKIEDQRVAGKSLADAAKAVGIEPRMVQTVDAAGLDPAGAAVDLPEKKALLRAVYASDVGVDDAALSTPDHGYVWFEIAKIDPARERTFDEVKDKVEAQWRADEVTRALGAKALDMIKQLDGGATLASLAQSAGVEVKSAANVRRSGGEGLAPGVVTAVFATPPNGAGSAATPDGRVVFKITADSTPPTKLDDPAVKAAMERLSEALQTGLVEQYVTAVEHQLGVRIHENVLQGAEGG